MKASEIVKQMSDEEVIKILEDLGSDNYRYVNDGILFRTICHNGANSGKLKLHYHRDSKTFHCYTECGQIGNIFNLYMHMYGCEFNDAYVYICEELNISMANIPLKYGFTEITDTSFINKFNNNSNNIKLEDLIVKDDNVLNRFSDMFYQKWIDEHISIETMKLFNIKFDILEGCIIIPHYNIAGDLIGIRARHLKENVIESFGKYMPLTIDGESYSYPTRLNLFGLNVNMLNIIKYKTIVIGESEKFVMQHKTFYPDTSTAVGLNGSVLSDEHIEILKGLGVETVVLALDKEYTNQEESDRYSILIKRKIVDKLYPFFNVEILWDRWNLIDYKDAPTDKGKEIYEELYKNRIIYHPVMNLT